MDFKKIKKVFRQKPHYPSNDREIIALMQSELQKQNIQRDISVKDLSLGYLLEKGKNYVVVVCSIGEQLLLLGMDRRMMLISSNDSGLTRLPIDLTVDWDHLLEDSFHYWGLFIGGGHFTLGRMIKD